jgi:hypothetical protein
MIPVRRSRLEERLLSCKRLPCQLQRYKPFRFGIGMTIP